MAFTVVKKIPLNAVRIISERDDAIDAQASDYRGYFETLDESKLKYFEGKEPTVFICNFDLKLSDAKLVKDSLVTGFAEDGQPKLAIGSYHLNITKVVLKDIQNPSYVEDSVALKFKKTPQGYPTDKTLEDLSECGLPLEIATFYDYHSGRKPGAEKVKN